MDLEVVADCACVVGEGPLWHPLEQQLYWTDIPTGRMFRYDPGTHRYEQFYQGDPVGGFTCQEDGDLLLFGPRGSVTIWGAGRTVRMIEEIPAERETRFNDVIADPRGRVFAGTMPGPNHPAHLYRLHTDGTLTLILDRLGQANGMGFTPDRSHLYLTDTRKRVIYQFEYDPDTGRIAEPRVFTRVPEDEGAPDGLTVDRDGYVWSARWGGGCVVRYAPDGREDGRILLPTPKVTSVAFGGPDYSELYITTGGGDDREANGPEAGMLFRVRPGVRGVPEFLSRVWI